MKALLAVDDYIAQAARETGLDDFGPDGWQEPLAMHLEIAAEEARLSPMGRMILSGEINARLKNRLMIQQWVVNHPHIHDQQISPSIVLATLPRTGQTAAGWIFDRDPDNRSLLRWFTKTPIPPPTPESVTTDPRIASEAAQLEFIPPEVMDMHLMHPQEPDECHWLLSNDMKIPHDIYAMHVPSYYRWVRDQADMRSAYDYYALQLKVLQSTWPTIRWIFKNSPHLLFMDDLHRVLPDVTYVQFHRDPLKVLASNCKLAVMLRSMRSDDVDPREVGESMLELLGDYIDRLMRFRKEGAPAQWIDVRFADFVHDPLSAVSSIYNAADLALSDSTERAMQSWVDANPRSDQSRARPADLSPYGISDGAAKERFSAYIDHFDLEHDGI